MAFRILEAPAGSVSGSRDNDNKVTRTVSREFTLDADSTTETRLTAIDALAFLGVFEGASYPGSLFYFCESVSLNQTGPISYEASANYKTIPFRGSDNPNADPVLERAKITYSTNNASVETDVDINGVPLKNAAEEIYQGITKDVGDLVISIQKKYAIFRPFEFYEYINTVNNATFLGFPAGTLRVTSIGAQEVFQDDFIYWDVSVQLAARKPLASGVTNAQAWHWRQRSEGFYCRVGSGDPQRCVDEAGEPVSIPFPIDKTSGVQLAFGATPQFEFFQFYATSNFNAMNLGVS